MMAESAAVPVLEIKNEFGKCKICLEYYDDGDRCPRVLPCQHTFCSRCLESVWKKSTDGIRCPNCRRVWPVKNSIEESFPKNSILINLVEYITMKNKPERLMCHECPNGSNATVRCLDCREYMCDTCRNYHNKFSGTKEHSTVLIGEFLEMSREEFFQQKEVCKQHKNINLDFFCGTCSTAVCYSCALVSHRNHDICNLTDVYEEKKEHLRSMLRGLQASTETWKEHRAKLREENTTLDVMQATLLQGIDDSYDKIIRKLSDRRKQLKDDVVSNIAKQKADRDEEMELIAQSEGVKAEQVLYCQQALSFARAVQFIEMSQDLENKIKTLEQGPEFNNLQIQDIIVDDTFKQVDKVMEKTGVIYDGLIFKKTKQDVDVTRRLLLNTDSDTGRYQEVLLPSVEFDSQRLYRRWCCISSDDELINQSSSVTENLPASLKHLKGVTARTVMSEHGCSYCETDVNIHVLESADFHKVAAQVGVSTDTHADDELFLHNNKHAWCVSVVSCIKHNSMCLKVVSRGEFLCDVPVSAFQLNSNYSITLGFLLEPDRETLHVIHVNTNTLVHTIPHVDVTQPLMPLFAVYSPVIYKVKLRVMSATNLCLSHELLTLLSSLVHQ